MFLQVEVHFLLGVPTQDSISTHPVLLVGDQEIQMVLDPLADVGYDGHRFVAIVHLPKDVFDSYTYRLGEALAA